MKRALPLLLILLVTIVSGVREGTSSSDVPGDFLRYHRAGRVVWTGLEDKLYDMRYTRGQHVYAQERAADLERRGEDADDFVEREWKYAPATAVMLAPIGSLHPKTGIALWGAWNGFLISLCWVACWHWASQATGKPLSGHWMWLAVLALWRIGEDNLHLGQLNPSAIVPATLGLYCLARGRQVAAGALIAFGTVVKFMPGGLAIWLAWKRQWKALGVWAVGVVLLGYGLPVVAFGPDGARDVNQAWIDARAHHYTKAEIPDVPGHSIKSFVYRTLGGIPYQSGRDEKRVEIDISVAQLPPSALAWITMALNVLVLAVVLYTGRGRLEPWSDPRGPPVAALFLASLLFISPEARGPHFLYLSLAGITLTYLLVRTARTDARASLAWKVALGLAIVGTLLLQTDSKGLFGRTAAKTMSAYCTKGFGALAWMSALMLLLPARRPPEDVPADLAA